MQLLFSDPEIVGIWQARHLLRHAAHAVSKAISVQLINPVATILEQESKDSLFHCT